MSWMRRYAVRCCRMPSLLSPSSSGHQHHPSLKRRRRQITASAGLGSYVETDLAREFVRRFHPHAREGTVQNVRNRRGRFPWKLESLPQNSTSRDCRARARSRCGKDTTKTRGHKPPESSSRPSAMSMTRKSRREWQPQEGRSYTFTANSTKPDGTRFPNLDPCARTRRKQNARTPNDPPNTRSSRSRSRVRRILHRAQDEGAVHENDQASNFRDHPRDGYSELRLRDYGYPMPQKKGAYVRAWMAETYLPEHAMMEDPEESVWIGEVRSMGH
jgi:hypothetical protein